MGVQFQMLTSRTHVHFEFNTFLPNNTGKINENSRYFGIRVSHLNDHKFVTQSELRLNTV